MALSLLRSMKPKILPDCVASETDQKFNSVSSRKHFLADQFLRLLWSVDSFFSGHNSRCWSWFFEGENPSQPGPIYTCKEYQPSNSKGLRLKLFSRSGDCLRSLQFSGFKFPFQRFFTATLLIRSVHLVTNPHKKKIIRV